MKTARTIAALIAAVLTLGLLAPFALAATVSITSGTQYRDTGGGIVHAHGGGVIKVGSYYYLYGENRDANNNFVSVSMYRSTNMRDWEFRSNVLTATSAAELNVSNIERPKILYNASTGRYVMWMHKEAGNGDYSQARAAVASSATIDGDYTYHGSFRPLGHMSRDIGVYQEGTAAYMYSAADENRDMHIYRLSADYLNVESLVANPWPDQSRESPALFKRGSTYFMLTSGTTGWSPNQQKYATAASITGPWTSMQNVGDSTAFGSQTTFVLPITGTSTTSYLYMGDRWAGAWDQPVNESEYLWLPLSFPSATSMSLSHSAQITIDTATGVVAGVQSRSGLALSWCV